MKKILCAMDLSQRSEFAVQRAALLAQRIGAELLLLHVVDEGKPVRMIRRRTTRARIVLEWRARDLEKTGCKAQVSVIVGKRQRAITRFAEEWGADLIVLGGRRCAHGDGPAVNALPYAAATTEPHSEQYLQYMRRSTNDTLAAQFEAAGLDLSQFSIFQRDAAPLRAIDDVAQRIESDLVVVGASRFPALKRTLVGSVSSEVVRNLQCDVLVVPPGALPRVHRAVLAEDLQPPAC